MIFRCAVVFSTLMFAGLASGCGPQDAESPQKTEETGAISTDGSLEAMTPEQAAKVVARVGDKEITVGEVTEQINRLSPYIRRRWATPEKRKEFLQKLIRIELLSQEAERQGLGDDPEVQRTVKQVMIRLMVKNDLQKDFLPTSVDEKTLKEEYDKQSDKFHKSPQIRISHILVATRAEAEALITTFKASPDDRKIFRDKARELSLDEVTKNRGGDLGYFSKPDADDVDDSDTEEPKAPVEVVTAAWTLSEIGDMVETPVKTDAGFHVIKLTNKKPEMNRSFESVKRLLENRILRQLRREKMDEFVEGLKKKADIKIYEDNLARLKLTVAEEDMKAPVSRTAKDVSKRDEPSPEKQ